MAQGALQNIFDIDIARLQVGVIQLAILLAELHQHLMPCPFRRALFGEQTIVGGIKQIVIVEQGVVPGEDRRDIGVKFIFRQLGQGDKIRQRLVNGTAQALLLAGGIGGSRAERLDQGQRIAQGSAFDALGRCRSRCRLRRRRFTEVIGGQRLKRRQRRVGIRTAGQQAQLIVAADLQ